MDPYYTNTVEVYLHEFLWEHMIGTHKESIPVWILTSTYTLSIQSPLSLVHPTLIISTTSLQADGQGETHRTCHGSWRHWCGPVGAVERPAKTTVRFLWTPLPHWPFPNPRQRAIDAQARLSNSAKRKKSNKRTGLEAWKKDAIFAPTKAGWSNLRSRSYWLPRCARHHRNQKWS